MNNVHTRMEAQVLRALSDTDEPLREVSHKQPRYLPKVLDGSVLTWVKPQEDLEFEFYIERWRHDVLVEVEYLIKGGVQPVKIGITKAPPDDAAA